MTIAWSRHSVRIERTTRSAMAFARGARTGVRTLAMQLRQADAERATVDGVAVVDEVLGLPPPKESPRSCAVPVGSKKTSRGHRHAPVLAQ